MTVGIGPNFLHTTAASCRSCLTSSPLASGQHIKGHRLSKNTLAVTRTDQHRKSWETLWISALKPTCERNDLGVSKATDLHSGPFPLFSTCFHFFPLCALRCGAPQSQAFIAPWRSFVFRSGDLLARRDQLNLQITCQTPALARVVSPCLMGANCYLSACGRSDAFMTTDENVWPHHVSQQLQWHIWLKESYSFTPELLWTLRTLPSFRAGLKQLN